MNTASSPVHTSYTSWSGWLLLSIIPLTILATLTDKLPAYIAGIPIWLAMLTLLNQQRRGHIAQSAALMIIGATGLIISFIIGGNSHFLLKAIEANQTILSMLIAVSFLRLVTLNEPTLDKPLPSGIKALCGTLLGGHLIGAVINISSVILLGDKLSTQRPLNSLQGLTLLRAFSTCAVWSPFFAAMGVALVSAPGAQLGTLVLFGIPVAITALLFSTWQISRHPDATSTHGYPLQIKTLWMPVMLAILVMLAHHFWPDVSVLTLVTVISILFTLLWLPLNQGHASIDLLHHHIQTGLPRLGSEVSLFVAAAVLASGVGALLTTFNLQLSPAHFGPIEACMTVVVLVVAALIGMHPVTSVVLAGSILMPTVDDPNLLGITLLLSWSLGIGLSPFSGVQISLQSRYNISTVELMKLNRYYAPIIFIIAFATIATYSLVYN